MSDYRKPMIALHLGVLIMLTLAFLGARGHLNETESTVVEVNTMLAEDHADPFHGSPPRALAEPETEREQAALTWFERFRSGLFKDWERNDFMVKTVLGRLSELQSFLSMHSMFLLVAMVLSGLSLLVAWKQ